MTGPPDATPHGRGIHKPVALEQRDMLADANGADAQCFAQFSSRHLAATPEQLQDLLACLPLLALFQCHRRTPPPLGCFSIIARLLEYSTRVSALSRKCFQKHGIAELTSACTPVILRANNRILLIQRGGGTGP